MSLRKEGTPKKEVSDVNSALASTSTELMDFSSSLFRSPEKSASQPERLSKDVKEKLLVMDDDAKLKFFTEIFESLNYSAKLLSDVSRIVDRKLRSVKRCDEPFSYLPLHLGLMILNYMDPKSLCTCMLVCRSWHDLCNVSSLWRSLCNHSSSYRLGSAQVEWDQLRANAHSDGTIRWKQAFSERYRLWRNWHAGRCVIRTFTGHDQGITCIQFDAQRIVSGSSDATIRIWDMKSNNFHGVGHITLRGHSATVRCLSLQHNRLASGSNDHTIKIWDLAVNDTWSHIACRRTLLGHRNVVRCLQMLGDTLISGSYDQSIRIWSIETGQCVNTLEGSTASVLCLQYDPGNNRIVSGTSDASIRVWDDRASPAGESHLACEMTIHNAHDAGVTCVRMNNERIVSGSVDRTIRIWDLRMGRCLQTIDWKQAEGHIGVVRALQTDSWRIVSAADDKTVKVWKLSNGNRLCTLHGHTDGVTCVQFNDNHIVSGSYDKTVKLWDFSTC